MARIGATVIVALLLVDTAFCFLNTTLKELDENDLALNTRRRRKKDRSTSSSSGQRRTDSSEDGDNESLGISTSSSSSSEDKKYPKPKSSAERKGWRKWHRKCTKCQEDMKKKWRDPSIKWICGQYQRARRSFKSLCMMHYRNCQDGTMFVKISNHRCANSTGREEPRRGEHFFYDYKAKMYDDSTDSRSSETSEDSDSDTSLLFGD